MAATNGSGAEHAVVLVTGASSGIGQAIAERLARQGWRWACEYRAKHGTSRRRCVRIDLSGEIHGR